MTSFERLEIYNRSYWFRLLSSFYEDFPGLRAVLGNSKFENLAVAYLSANPSASFTLRDLGRNLESWLRTHPKWLGDSRRLAMDMVRLEWAEIETFDSGEEEPLSVEHAHGLHGQSILQLQPYLKLLDLRYPVDDMLIAIRKSNDFDGTAASNAVDNIRRLPRTRGMHKGKPENIYLAVHRQEHSVYFKRMEKGAFVALRALGQGATLARAYTKAVMEANVEMSGNMEVVREWFRDWSRWGWICGSRSQNTIGFPEGAK
jgi:hypothetical protein